MNSIKGLDHEFISEHFNFPIKIELLYQQRLYVRIDTKFHAIDHDNANKMLRIM